MATEPHAAPALRTGFKVVSETRPQHTQRRPLNVAGHSFGDRVGCACAGSANFLDCLAMMIEDGNPFIKAKKYIDEPSQCYFRNHRARRRLIAESEASYAAWVLSRPPERACSVGCVLIVHVEMTDVAQMLGMGAAPSGGASSGARPKPTRSKKGKKPGGVSREVFALLGPDSLPSMVGVLVERTTGRSSAVLYSVVDAAPRGC